MTLPNGLRQTVLCAFTILGLYAAASFAADPSDVRFQVSTEWLNSHRTEEKVRILDLRPATDYQQSHIDGAVSLPIENLFSSDKGKHYIATLDRIRSAFGGAGIDSDVLAVIYDGGELVNATRAFWVFEVYGHSRVVVLDGGFTAWVDTHLPVSSKETIASPRAFVPRIAPNRLATKLTTRLAIDRPNTVIVDVRDSDQYLGEKSVAPRAGHIPSAINISGKDIYDESDGARRLKPIGELAALYKNINPNTAVVTYCNDGVRASATYFVLRRLGYNVANYDGAWLEWGNDASLPISTQASSVPTVTRKNL